MHFHTMITAICGGQQVAVNRAIKKRGEDFEKTALNLTSTYGINIVGDSYPELLSEILTASTSADKQKRDEAFAVLKEVLLL